MSNICFICCNQCFESNADVKLKFFVSNCYHIFCAGCLASNKNFCSICNKKCKTLLIDDSLPKEVKTYFEPNARQQIFHTLQKVHEFQTSQVKTYAEKQYSHRKRYYLCKQKILELHNYRKQVIESLKRERSIMEKLKEGYRTNIISPELFQMRSPAISSNVIKTPVELKNSPMGSVSSSATMFNNIRKKSVDSNQPMDTSSSLTLSNFNRGSSNTQKTTDNKLIKEARKGLIAQTLRGMNEVSQPPRSQVRQSQNINYYKNTRI